MTTAAPSTVFLAVASTPAPATDFGTHMNWSVVLSAIGVLAGYVCTWISDRMAKRDAAEVERLSNQVICFGKIVAASSVHAQAVKNYASMYQNRAHKDWMILLEKHSPTWMEANYAEAERLASTTKNSSVADQLARMLYLCEDLPPEFHKEILDIPAQRAWIAHIRSTTLPLNEEIETQILSNLHLFDELPSKEGIVVSEHVMAFFAYCAAYRRLVSLWDVGDYTMLITPVRFPKEFVTDFQRLYFTKKATLAQKTYELSQDFGVVRKLKPICCCHRHLKRQIQRVSKVHDANLRS
jgi:hypothetical protein